MDQKDINNLLHRLANNQLTELQRVKLYSWLDSLDENAYRDLLDQYQKIILQKSDDGIKLPELEKRIEYRINQLPKRSNTVNLSKWIDLAMVAGILLLAVTGTRYALSLISNSGIGSEPAKIIASQFGDDVLPGSEKATLILSDGKKIILDDVAEGQLNLEGGIEINKTGDGKIAYRFTGSDVMDITQPSYHTITTPIGGEYQVTLPDGSKVWLNSMSSLTTPNIFGAESRSVNITGEVYFEVAEQFSSEGKKIPFLVRTANQTIEVLGTQFNVKAYPDQKMLETTLVEGKVEVITQDRKVTLYPGDQSKVDENGGIQQYKDVNIGKIIAWKNGYFQFSDDSILDIMKQLSRWYEIEVEYLNTISESRFGGQISRSRNISEVLRILELTNEVSFKIEGKKVSVWKK